MASRKRNKRADATPTIFDVAQSAGVSIKTVSRVVNHEPNVRATTRERVLAAIDELNYRPNTAARGLSSQRSYVIGLVYESADEFGYLKHVLDGALASCEAEGYSLLLRPLTLPRDDVLEQLRRFVQQARVEGVILPAPIGDLAGVSELLNELGVPLAALTPKSPKADAVNIFCDDALAMRSLTRVLIDQGHQHIGFVKGHPDHRACDERYRGFRTALDEAGLPLRPELVRQGYFNFDSGRTAAAELLALTQRPTAIVASSDDMAVGVVFEARERGLFIPEDLSVVGFDDTPVGAHCWPPLTTVRQPIAAMAERATMHLIQRLRGEREAVADEPFRCEVILRRSTRPVR